MIHILPMRDHYAMMHNGRVVGVVCSWGGSDTQWGVSLLEGRVRGVATCIPLHYALAAAMTWVPES